MSNNIYGIDFGTCNFKVFSKSSGKVVSEKTPLPLSTKRRFMRMAMMPMQCMKSTGKHQRYVSGFYGSDRRLQFSADHDF